jgi:hypothetical protein
LIFLLYINPVLVPPLLKIYNFYIRGGTKTGYMFSNSITYCVCANYKCCIMPSRGPDLENKVSCILYINPVLVPPLMKIYIDWLIDNCLMSKSSVSAIFRTSERVSEWLLFNAKWAIFSYIMTSYILIRWW